MDNVPESLWVRKNPLTDTESCLQCDYNIPTSEMRTPYCPWCGRKMTNWDADYTYVSVPLENVSEKWLQYLVELKNIEEINALNAKWTMTIPTEGDEK